jgi:CRISPR/Cas system CSM-associated protein Csm3 (group 7 of RAMP superfamily)
MGKIEIALRVTARSPFSIGAGGSAGTLANKSILRDGRNRPIIPGSQVKGKARHVAEALLRGVGRGAETPAHFDDDRETWIGQIFGTIKRRSPLYFADLAATLEPADWLAPAPRRPEDGAPALDRHLFSTIRPSVSLSRSLGTAENARLLFQETCHEALAFESPEAIVGALDAIGHAALLWAALRLNHSWGGAKTRGLGWATVEVRVKWEDSLLEEADLVQELRNLLPGETGA